MTKFVEKLKMKEQAEEDRYFAEHDRELIKALRKKKLAKALEIENEEHKAAARMFEREFDHVSDVYRDKPKKRLKAYRRLLNMILALFGIGDDKKKTKKS